MATERSPSAPGFRGGRRLQAERLRRRADPARLPFETTAELDSFRGTAGQPRALDAIEVALEIATPGFNLYTAGLPGSGRLSTVLDRLREHAARRPRPDDWVYVHNFTRPDRPQAIRLAGGEGAAFAAAMREFVATARREITRAFESEEFDRRHRALVSELAEARDALAAELRRFGAERGFALELTPVGVVRVPIVRGKPLTMEEFAALPAEERRRLDDAGDEVEEQSAAFLRRVHALEKETVRRISELQREAARFATSPLFNELRERYRENDDVLSYLRGVESDMLAHLEDFRAGEQPAAPPFGLGRERDLSRYEVNVLVDNGALAGAPVVVERHPSHPNLVGRIEYRPTFGTMVTDFREIKPGALHRANGGFLVLELNDLARYPFAWETLKRALRSRRVRVENLGEHLGAVPAATLRPAAIPIDVKVVIVGPRLAYYLLYRLDEDFPELFKIKADFAPAMRWNREGELAYAGLVSRWAREAGLRHATRGAVARLIEHGARLAEDQRELTTRMIEISDVLAEASFRAGKAGRDLVEAADVAEAIAAREYRANLLEERLQRLVADGTIAIETTGERGGRVNGLSVIDVGDYAFARPCRISAQVAVGRGDVVSVEREIELSGPIHSKGVLIVAGYLAGTYAQDRPLALSARLTFEQSYDEVEGDSASCAELLALLSALSGLPLRQGIAVTGSVNQHGDVQAVGGVTHKVEGFYATCRARGLTGEQGVAVPAANMRNLMLSDEVVDAVSAGRFHVWAIRTVDEALELLTGVRAGRRRADGAYPRGTVHALVAARLDEYAARLRRSLRAEERDDAR